MCIIDPMDLPGGDCCRDLQLLAFLLERFRARSEPVRRKKACKFKRPGSVETKLRPFSFFRHPGRWPRSDLAESLDGPVDRRLFGQSQVRSQLVVIASIGSNDPAQMGFAENDDVIEAFPADRADQSLRVPVLPG
jgi:hypothetical protein